MAGQSLHRLLLDARRVPVPRAVIGQAGEVRVQDALQVAVAVHEGGDRELVEDQHDDRGRLPDRDRAERLGR